MRDLKLMMELASKIENGERFFTILDAEQASIIGIDPSNLPTREEAERLEHHLDLLQQCGFIHLEKVGGGGIIVDGLTMSGYDWLSEQKMKRDKHLLQQLLIKMSDYMKPGVTYHFRSTDDELQIEGYNQDQIEEGLKILLDHGYMQATKSQPADGGILSNGITSSGYDLIDENDGSQSTAKITTRNEVFIVHGRDDGTRETVARFIEKIELKPVILHERPNKGRTLITKFQEEAAGVGFAVVLMTPDDTGGAVGSQPQPRARQNVVFELGFFIGAIGAGRVAALTRGNIERPSDFEGVVYISLENGDWRTILARELEAAGFSIDWNRVMKI